ncbi:MAG: hypothetical protein J0L92_06860 [Deltaproteobacteria bacterium]|nr:hypothetical protein [Deltaproteobacteria bacterium]
MTWRRAQLTVMPRLRARSHEAVRSVLAILSEEPGWQPSHWGPSIQQRRPFSEADLLSWLPIDRDADGREEELVVRRMTEPPHYLLRWVLTPRPAGGTFQLALLPDATPSTLASFFSVCDRLVVTLDALYGGIQLADWDGDPKSQAGASGIHDEVVAQYGLDDVFPRTFLAAELAAGSTLEAVSLSPRMLCLDAVPRPWAESPARVEEGMKRLRTTLVTAGLVRTWNGVQLGRGPRWPSFANPLPTRA